MIKDNDLEEQQVTTDGQFHIEVPAHSDDVAVRLQLLAIAKEILEHQTGLLWETHKQVKSVSIEDVIEAAEKLHAFVFRE